MFQEKKKKVSTHIYKIMKIFMSIVEIKSNALKMEVQDTVVRSYGIKKKSKHHKSSALFDTLLYPKKSTS